MNSIKDLIESYHKKTVELDRRLKVVRDELGIAKRGSDSELVLAKTVEIRLLMNATQLYEQVMRDLDRVA